MIRSITSPRRRRVSITTALTTGRIGVGAALGGDLNAKSAFRWHGKPIFSLYVNQLLGLLLRIVRPAHVLPRVVADRRLVGVGALEGRPIALLELFGLFLLFLHIHDDRIVFIR